MGKIKELLMRIVRVIAQLLIYGASHLTVRFMIKGLFVLVSITFGSYDDVIPTVVDTLGDGSLTETEFPLSEATSETASSEKKTEIKEKPTDEEGFYDRNQMMIWFIIGVIVSALLGEFGGR